MTQHCPRCDRSIELPGGVVAFCPFCGQALAPTVAAAESPTLPPSPSTPTSAPERLGEYRLVRRLGQGGMGVVYEGEHVATGRRVAVKLIDVAASPEAIERFRQEGKLASAIAHPRCVFVLDADEQAGQPFIVLELMPGRTLEDEVRERGPLPLEEALGHTLDLIDGLEQVHRLGLIHRDVKPSNSFLDGEGRVKVGDFGLARALAASSRLTRTGTFVGTPLFAAPEQIKGEPLDARADVYSVCATLFFLLTGRAPHDSGDGDALGAMARAVADDPPLLRTRWPNLPRSLERTLDRGLARDREQRWPDLASLRIALTGSQVVRPDLALLGRRLAGFLFDALLLYGLGTGLLWFFFPRLVSDSGIDTWVLLPVAILYFGLCEGLWGLTLGRWLLGLRVWRADDVIPPGVWRGLWRAVVSQALICVPDLFEAMIPSDRPGIVFQVVWPLLLMPGLYLTVLIAMLSTARRRNGFRCLQDMLSGTRVVPAPSPSVPLQVNPAPASHGAQPADLPARLGSFLIRDQRWRNGDDRVLGSIDPNLGRPVWLWHRPASRPDLPEERQQLVRASRLRWLAQGEQDGQRWDAFLAPTGSPVVEVMRYNRPLSWPQAREVLEALADELIQAQQDDTLPETLSLSSVWLLPEGKVLLLDMPGPESEPVSPLDLLGEVALLLLEGEPSRRDLPRRPLPLHARNLLAELPRFGGSMRDVQDFREDLRATHHRPDQVSRPLRLLHLGMLIAAQTVCCAGWLPLFLLGAIVTLGLHNSVQQGGQLLGELDRARAASVAGLVAPTLHPTTRWPPTPFLAGYQEARKQLDRAYQPVRLYHQARREQLLAIRLRFGRLPFEDDEPLALTDPLDEEASFLATMLIFQRHQSSIMVIGCLLFWATVFLVCLVSAVLLHGGIRSLVLGVCVVRGDGSPASRLRCAWRTLLAWLVCVAPFIGARIIEEIYWFRWTPDGGPDWMLTLANLCWLAAVLLLIVSLSIILITPARSLHDRIAGTCLVPR
jgi:hypothetical protein